MIRPLLRVTIFIGLIASLSFAANLIMDTGGEVRVIFSGREYNLPPILLLLALILSGLAFYLFILVIRFCIATVKFVNGDETALTRFFNRNRERRGYELLADALVAIASGDGAAARSKAQRAILKLNQGELTNLVSAQAAELSGDTDLASKHYKAMLFDDKTRFVGVRGIMKQKLFEGDVPTALALAEKAQKLKPHHRETLDTLFKLQTQEKRWEDAASTLDAHMRAGVITREIAQRRKAVLKLAEAQEKIEAGEVEAGHAAALLAHKMSASLIPAAILVAESYALDGKIKKAEGVLKKSWGQNPHPNLAFAYADLVKDETSEQRIARFEKLVKNNLEHSESKMVMAELAIIDEDFPRARRALSDLNEEDATLRSLTLMAAIERGEGAPDATVRSWLDRAMNAPAGNAWVCENCGTVHGDWAAICTNCDAFDTILWRRPARIEQNRSSAPLLGFGEDIEGVISREDPRGDALEEGQISEVIAFSEAPPDAAS